MTSKLVVNTIEADTGISSVSFASSISMSSTSKFHFGDAGIDIGADTNINRPTAGALGFNINSSEKVRITSAGNVGIGTAVPEAASNYANLSLADTTGGQIELKRLSDDTKHYIWGNQNLNIAGGYANGASSSLRFYVNGANERLRITSSGSVMINKTSSFGSVPLQVKGSSSGLSDGGQIFDIGTAEGSSGTRLALGVSEDNFGWIRSYESGVGGRDIVFAASDEKMRITTAGQMVMGATTSKAKFEIKDSGYTSSTVLQRISGDDANPYALIIANDTCNTAAASGLQFFVSDTGEHYIRARASSTAGNNNLRLVAQNNVALYSGSSETERLRIDSSGRVLLGTSSVYQANSYSNNLVIYENGDTGASIIGNNSNSNYASLYLSDTSTASRAYLEAQLGANGNFTIGASGTGPIRFVNNGAERVRIDGNGRLQVNMTSNVTGTAKLEVMGTGDNSYPMYSYGIGVADTQAYNVSNGAGMGIGFSYKHNSGGSYALGCGIRGFKENTTDGDYAGAMAFYTRPNGSGAVERMRISSEGYVTMPNQPSFYGRGYNGNNSGNWKFDAVASSNGEHNQGNHFNNNTGIFTCPVAGHYFIGGGWGYTASNDYCMMGFRYNGNTQLNLWEDGRSAPNGAAKHVSASLGLVIQCNANDTLSFVAHSGYSEPATATVHAWGSIYLVG